MILDFDLEFVTEAARFFDSQLDRLDLEAKASEDPDMFGVFDRGEYVVGLGFAACQQYLTAVCARESMSRAAAFDCGPHHCTGRPIAAIVNAVANHWKHSAEWTEPPGDKARRTIDTLESIGVDLRQEYALCNIFHLLLSPLPARFERLLPFLIQWRDEVRGSTTPRGPYQGM